MTSPAKFHGFVDIISKGWDLFNTDDPSYKTRKAGMLTASTIPNYLGIGYHSARAMFMAHFNIKPLPEPNDRCSEIMDIGLRNETEALNAFFDVYGTNKGLRPVLDKDPLTGNWIQRTYWSTLYYDGKSYDFAASPDLVVHDRRESYHYPVEAKCRMSNILPEWNSTGPNVAVRDNHWFQLYIQMLALHSPKGYMVIYCPREVVGNCFDGRAAVAVVTIVRSKEADEFFAEAMKRIVYLRDPSMSKLWSFTTAAYRPEKGPLTYENVKGRCIWRYKQKVFEVVASLNNESLIRPIWYFWLKSWGSDPSRVSTTKDTTWWIMEDNTFVRPAYAATISEAKLKEVCSWRNIPMITNDFLDQSDEFCE